MKETLRKLKVVIVVLLIILLSLIAFIGIFEQDKGTWNNVIPEYKLGMDIEGTRELRYVLDDSENEKYVYVDDDGNVITEVWKDGAAITAEQDTDTNSEATDESNLENADETVETNIEENVADNNEEDNTELEDENGLKKYKKETRTIKTNKDEDLTKENFEKAKSILQERLKKQGIDSYNIRLDDVTGKLVIETNNNDDNVKAIEDVIKQAGKFQIIDNADGAILMDNSDIKSVDVTYSNESSYTVYLQMKFNKEGAKKLKEISTKYVKTEIASDDESEENAEASGETETREISAVMDGTVLFSTYFEEEMTGGAIQFTVGQATTEYSDFIENVQSAKLIADSINTGELPIIYSLQTDNYVKSAITNKEKNVALIVFCVINVIIFAAFIIKYKVRGLLASISSIGFIAAIAIVARYTNVLITVNSLITYMIMIAMNDILTNMCLKNNNEKGFLESLKKFYLYIIPIIATVFVFIFTKYATINSIGMVGFWGIILIAVYNLIFLKTILDK